MMQVLLPDYLRGFYKPPSLNAEDKISITPFLAGEPAIVKLGHEELSPQPGIASAGKYSL